MSSDEETINKGDDGKPPNKGKKGEQLGNGQEEQLADTDSSYFLQTE
jgi:hypothetical protein